MYKKFIKRWLDFIFALLLLIVLSPLFVILSLLVLIFLGTPVIFKQQRPGKDEKIFTLYKFRTMTNAKDKHGRLLPDEQRLTKFGKFLRASSLDELPELWNILKGDMSFVGPRPLLVEYLPYYTSNEKLRHSVRPGLTGYAQVNGRNTTSWDKRLSQDVFYVRNYNFLLDVKIFIKTFLIVFRRSDILMGEDMDRQHLSLNEERKVKKETK